MANPIYLASLKLPMTEKPGMLFSAENQLLYQDVFNIQNTIKIMLASFTEEAPNDGTEYVRKDSSWVPSSGGGGGIPEAPEDGKTYGRKDATWVEVTSGSGGFFSGFSTYGTIGNSASASACKAAFYRTRQAVTLTAVTVGGNTALLTNQHRISIATLKNVVVASDGTVTAAQVDQVLAQDTVFLFQRTGLQYVKVFLTTPVTVPANTNFLLGFHNIAGSGVTPSDVMYIDGGTNVSAGVQVNFPGTLYRSGGRFNSTTLAPDQLPFVINQNTYWFVFPEGNIA